MAVDNRLVLRATIEELAKIDRDRVEFYKKPVDFSAGKDGLKDAMFYIHRAYQSLNMQVQSGKGLPETMTEPAVQLAAAGIKLVTDLIPAAFFVSKYGRKVA